MYSINTCCICMKTSTKPDFTFIKNVNSHLCILPCLLSIFLREMITNSLCSSNIMSRLTFDVIIFCLLRLQTSIIQCGVPSLDSTGSFHWYWVQHLPGNWQCGWEFERFFLFHADHPIYRKWKNLFYCFFITFVFHLKINLLQHNYFWILTKNKRIHFQAKH